jgi:hypothetical protein
MTVPSRHSELDSESRFSKEWIPGARDDGIGAIGKRFEVYYCY